MKYTRHLMIVVGSAVVVALLVLVAHVRALFSAEVEIKNNVIKTGSVAITVTPNEQLFAADTLLPGQSVDNTLQIKNSGLSPLQLTLSAKKSAGYTTLYDQLRFVITNGDAIVYDGLLKDLVNIQITSGAVTPQQSLTYHVSLMLPVEADNSIDNLSTTISFVVAATQAS